ANHSEPKIRKGTADTCWLWGLAQSHSEVRLYCDYLASPLYRNLRMVRTRQGRISIGIARWGVFHFLGLRRIVRRLRLVAGHFGCGRFEVGGAHSPILGNDLSRTSAYCPALDLMGANSRRVESLAVADLLVARSARRRPSGPLLR